MAGWAGLLIIIGATAVTCFTAKVLVRCIETLNERHIAISTYDRLVQHTFGWYGGLAMKVMTVAELYGGVVCMVVLHAINWPTLLGVPPEQLQQATVLVAMLVCSLAFPTLLVQTRHLATFAVAGLCATCAVFVVTVVAPILAELPAADGTACTLLDASNHDGDQMGHALLHVRGLGVATGLGLFAFAGHATFPELWKSMPAEQRKRFGRSCDVGFALAAGFYCGLATLGYYFFGDCAADSLTLNLMSSSPLLGSMATGCVLLSTFSSISVLCVPVVRICTEAAACGDRKQMAERRRHEQSGGVGLWQPYDRRTWAIKALLMIIAALLAVTVPNFGFLVSMMGAVTCMLISFILPVMCNIVVHRQQLSTLGLASNIAIVLLGLVGMAVGVQSTLERAS